MLWSLPPEMEFKSILLLGIFLVVATKVTSYDEDLKIQGKYGKGPGPAPVPAAAPTPKAPQTPSPVPVPVPVPAPVKTPPYVPPLNAPPPPLVKSPSYPPPPPFVKSPSYPPPPPSPYVKAPPPPVGKPPFAPSPSPPAPIVKSKKDCIPLCSNRCQLHSRTRVCMRACMTCCDRCKCVPPGTYGNREKCGKCYTDMTTHNNRSKCP